MFGDGGSCVVYRAGDSDLDNTRHSPRYEQLVQQTESGS
jgi:hypothetical protein